MPPGTACQAATSTKGSTNDAPQHAVVAGACLCVWAQVHAVESLDAAPRGRTAQRQPQPQILLFTPNEPSSSRVFKTEQRVT